MKSAFIRRRSGVQRNSNSTAPIRTRSPGPQTAALDPRAVDPGPVRAGEVVDEIILAHFLHEAVLARKARIQDLEIRVLAAPEDELLPVPELERPRVHLPFQRDQFYLH